MLPNGNVCWGPTGPDDGGAAPPDAAGVAPPVVCVPAPAPADPPAAILELPYWQEVPRQTAALLRKNFTLAWRNRVSTFLRLFASLFFILLIFLVNEGIKARTALLSSYKDLPTPPRKVIAGIPACANARGRDTCYTFGYIPAPYSNYVPATSYDSLADWISEVDGAAKAEPDWCFNSGKPFTRCTNIDCEEGPVYAAAAAALAAIPPSLIAALTGAAPSGVVACGECCEMWRAHKVVRAIMTNNASATSGDKSPIPSSKVFGWPDEKAADKYILDNPQMVQGTYLFDSPDPYTMTFVVQQNSSKADQIRKAWTRPFLELTIPMEAAASIEIARQIFLNEPALPIEIALQEYPHPAINVASFEGDIAPLFLLGFAMFPFVIQMTEIVYEREFKLRQALAAMGLYDLSYWLSWHLYQSTLAFFSSILIYTFGCLFQFNIFLKNDFGVIFFTFWMFGQAVTVGFTSFMVCFIVYFCISAGVPYGSYKGTPPIGFTTNITTGNLTALSGGAGALSPLFSLLPPSMLIKAIADMGALSFSTKDQGLRFANAYAYCTLENTCDPAYSIGTFWVAWLVEYILYSILALYFENVLPDAMGVRKAPWYFVTASYWGVGSPNVIDKVEVLEASTDEDVIAEEQANHQRANQPFDESLAIEIRGLRQTFSRGGKAFHAVKDPWFAVGKKQLFCLLGPNGAGKTTTINMLTGFLPPSQGNALVLGHTVAHSSGMNQIKRFMGVCPQFDILWDNLTAREHLVLFGAIKGVAQEAVEAEADRRIEQVRLSEAANQVAGTFSGGMKRRLSVAVALIGNPKIVYLDEPTTGMDPINRRHVWDVIEAAKQDRTIILTTHSMEEADILGDRIAIMAKGRLRCLGTSVRLKNRFGAGYRVSVSCGDHMKLDGPECMAVKQLFQDMFGITPEEETQAYIHFNVPASEDEKLSRLFAQLDTRAAELGIVDVQVGMSSLEDVFLTIAKKAEADEAKATNQTTIVHLKTGEQVGVLLGQEEWETSLLGTTFQVVWGTDKEGSLMPVSTIEKKTKDKTVTVTCPDGIQAGQNVEVSADGQQFQVTIPEGLAPGETFEATVKVIVKEGNTMISSETGQQAKLSVEDVNRRVAELQTSFFSQSNALFRKNLTFQGKRRAANCCLLLVPLFLTVLVLLLQLFIENLFLNRNFVRCPYCGPKDDFADVYCSGQDCADFFFYDNSTVDGALQRQAVIEQFDDDPWIECKKIMKTCGGKGNTECFQMQYSVGFQFAFCPFTIGPKQPDMRQTPHTDFRSKTPVIFTGKDKVLTSKVADKMYTKDSATDALNDVTDTLAKSMNFYTWQVLNVPKIGCVASAPNSNRLEFIMSDLTHQEAMCKLIQQGQGSNDPCCVDYSQAFFNGTFVPGFNVWTANPAHTKAAYEAAIAQVVANGVPGEFDGCGTDTTASTYQSCVVALTYQGFGSPFPPFFSPAHKAVQKNWASSGLKVASGYGKSLVIGVLAGASYGADSRFLDEAVALLQKSEPFFTCVEPKYTQVAQTALGNPTEDTCINLEEGMARLAHALQFPQKVMPKVAPDDNAFYDAASNTFEKVTVDNLDFYPDSPGRWAQACEFYTHNFTRVVLNAALKRDTLTLAEAEEYIARKEIPCGCRFLVMAKAVATLFFPTGGFAAFTMSLPELFNCANYFSDMNGNKICTPWTPDRPYGRTHHFALKQLKMGTSRWGVYNGFVDRALSSESTEWWNRDFVQTLEENKQFQLDEIKKRETSCESSKTCWIEQGTKGGRFSTISGNCSKQRFGNCYFSKMANLTGTSFECIDAVPEYQASLTAMNKRIYDGYPDRFSKTATTIEEFSQAYDFADTSDATLNVTVLFNDTTEVSGDTAAPKPMIRLSGGISDAVDAYVNYRKGTNMAYMGTMRGLKEMPQPASKLELDLGGIIGAFFFTLAFSLLFPTMVVAILYEKEQRLRVMMRMMGLGSAAYWTINYLFWFLVFTFHSLFILVVASTVKLPSGYTIGLFTKTDASVHLVNFFLWENFLISFSFFWATIVRSSRAGSISSTLFVLVMTLVGFLAWDGGGFFMSDSTSEGAKTVITMIPFWGFYRTWAEYGEYAYSGTRNGGMGLTWPKIIADEKCGMDTALLVHLIEWPLFLLLALYLDNVLDTGHGVPKHWLFFLGINHKEGSGEDVEAGGGAGIPEDVTREASRVEGAANGPREVQDAVMILGLNKVYPAYMGNPSKVAVKTISMGVKHGECFGMLGPNGAGKTTLISMLVGFATPTKGNAIIEGFSLRTDLPRVYTLMGVCPQHDILWETLTAREHMLFYGRLKNLRGAALTQGVTEGLRMVNLLSVMHECCGTFSGGMKRRLSVAISMIGSPLCCYLDEPSTGLDPASRRTLWTTIKEAKKTSAVFLTTHSMEEAEGLCDRLGIFVDGSLRCIGNPKELSARFGGFFVLTVTSAPGSEGDVTAFVQSLAAGVRSTYALAGTQKFEIPSGNITLAKVFGEMTANKARLQVVDWGIANTTLEEAFIKISKGAVGT